MNDFYYRKLNAYQHSKELVKYVYRILKAYPAEERYTLCDQLRRAAVSVPSNIAEGMGRFSVKERIHFLEIAYGSLMEVMCQLEISLSLKYIDEYTFNEGERPVICTAKTMSGLRQSLVEKQRSLEESRE